MPTCSPSLGTATHGEQKSDLENVERGMSGGFELLIKDSALWKYSCWALNLKLTQVWKLGCLHFFTLSSFPPSLALAKLGLDVTRELIQLRQDTHCLQHKMPSFKPFSGLQSHVIFQGSWPARNYILVSTVYATSPVPSIVCNEAALFNPSKVYCFNIAYKSLCCLSARRSKWSSAWSTKFHPNLNYSKISHMAILTYLADQRFIPGLSKQSNDLRVVQPHFLLGWTSEDLPRTWAGSPHDGPVLQ